MLRKISWVFLLLILSLGSGFALPPSLGEHVETGKKFYRNMDQTEMQAVVNSGKLRGGNPGVTFFTDEYYESAEEAQDKLSLPMKPEVQLGFIVKNDPLMLRNGSIVDPLFGGHGGGREYMTMDVVQVEVLSVQPYKK